VSRNTSWRTWYLLFVSSIVALFKTQFSPPNVNTGTTITLKKKRLIVFLSLLCFLMIVRTAVIVDISKPKKLKCARYPMLISCHSITKADRNSPAVWGKYCVPSLECWDHRFESCSGHGCVSAFLCAVLSCVGRGLESGRSPVQGVLPNVYRFTSKNPSTPQGKRGRLRKRESITKLCPLLVLFLNFEYILLHLCWNL
jgi:hypothetical protein